MCAIFRRAVYEILELSRFLRCHSPRHMHSITNVRCVQKSRLHVCTSSSLPISLWRNLYFSILARFHNSAIHMRACMQNGTIIIPMRWRKLEAPNLILGASRSTKRSSQAMRFEIDSIDQYGFLRRTFKCIASRWNILLRPPHVWLNSQFTIYARRTWRALVGSTFAARQTRLRCGQTNNWNNQKKTK